MNRIDQAFARLKSEGRKGLVGYLTAGDPDMEQSERNIRKAIADGLDVLELGVPFSDPTADGPTIQAASQRSLAAGTTLREVIALVARLRKDSDIPIVLFGYANPFFVYGYDALCANAAKAGVDGFLVVDMPFEESGEIDSSCSKFRAHETDSRAIRPPGMACSVLLRAQMKRLMRLLLGVLLLSLINGTAATNQQALLRE